MQADFISSIEAATHKYEWRGIKMVKNPFDLALYTRLLWDLKPRVIVEIGSWEGGSAVWLADMARAMGFVTYVHSVDINLVKSPFLWANVEFLKCDVKHLERVISDEMLGSPVLAIDDGSHGKDDVLAFLEFFGPRAAYMVVEDGRTAPKPGPVEAIHEWLLRNDGWEIDRPRCDFFGPNMTWNVDGWLKRSQS